MLGEKIYLLGRNVLQIAIFRYFIVLPLYPLPKTCDVWVQHEGYGGSGLGEKNFQLSSLLNLRSLRNSLNLFSWTNSTTFQYLWMCNWSLRNSLNLFMEVFPATLHYATSPAPAQYRHSTVRCFVSTVQRPYFTYGVGER
jgi:hypothetical protein